MVTVYIFKCTISKYILFHSLSFSLLFSRSPLSGTLLILEYLSFYLCEIFVSRQVKWKESVKTICGICSKCLCLRRNRKRKAQQTVIVFRSFALTHTLTYETFVLFHIKSKSCSSSFMPFVHSFAAVELNSSRGLIVAHGRRQKVSHNELIYMCVSLKHKHTRKKKCVVINLCFRCLSLSFSVNCKSGNFR